MALRGTRFSVRTSESRWAESLFSLLVLMLSMKCGSFEVKFGTKENPPLLSSIEPCCAFTGLRLRNIKLSKRQKVRIEVSISPSS
jgi:hypothetical protein